MAQVLNLSERRIRQLRDDGIIKCYQNTKGFDLLPALHSYLEYIRKGNPDGADKIDYNLERAKLAKAKRTAAEYELQLAQQQLLKADEVLQIMTTLLANFRIGLLSLPAKLSPVISKETQKDVIFKILKGAIDEKLNELSGEIDNIDWGETDGTTHP